MLLRRRPKQGISVFQAVVLSLVGIVLAMVLAGLVAAFGLNIQDSVDDAFTANSLEANASDNFKAGISNLSDQAPNIGLVAAAVVIITLLVVGFGGLAISKNR